MNARMWVWWAVVAIAIVAFLLSLMPRFRSFHVVTLADITAYAERVPEQLSIDNDDWWDPDFSSWYRSASQTIRRRLATVGLTASLYQYLTDLLSRVIVQRKQAPCAAKEHVLVLDPPENAQIYLWGSLQGSFHALSRSLDRLEQAGVITSDLTLNRPTDYFVFNGDLISRSAYSLETLAVILTLMLRNPNHVFFIRGQQESNSYWHNFGIKRELRYATGKTHMADIFLAQQLDELFELLPLALMLQGGPDEVTDGYIVIQSGFEHASGVDALRFSSCPGTVGQVAADVVCCPVKGAHDKKGRSFVAFIRSHLAAPLPTVNAGVTPVEPSQEAAVFFVLNAHNAAYRRLFDITQDTVALLKRHEQSGRWVIQDLRADLDPAQPFDLYAEYDLESGYKKTLLSELKIFSEAPLVVACLLDQHRDLAAPSARVASGVHAAVTWVNQRGGVLGRAIELFLQRHRFDRPAVTSAMQQLSQNDVTLMVSPLGTELLSILQQEQRNGEIPILFPIAAPDTFSTTDIPFFRPSYARQAEALITHLIHTESARSFTIVYANDAIGMSASQAAQRVLKQENIEAVSLIRYESRGPDFRQHLQTIRAAEQDVLCIFGTPSAALTLIRQVGVQNIIFDTLAGTSDLNSPEFAEFLRTKGLRMIVSNVVPNPQTSQTILAQQFRAYAQQDSIQLDVMTFEGFINVMLLVELLKQSKEANTEFAQDIMLSPELIGAQLNLSSESKSLSDTVWICTLPHETEQEWIRVPEPSH